jgi:hypothetical protein
MIFSGKHMDEKKDPIRIVNVKRVQVVAEQVIVTFDNDVTVFHKGSLRYWEINT